MKKTTSLLLLLSALLTQSALAVDNTAWFEKVRARIRYGHQFGKTSNGKRCSLQFSPSRESDPSKNGIIIGMSQTKLWDIFGTKDKPIADINVYVSDTLVGSSKYAGPHEEKNVTAFGYAKSAKTSSAKSLIVETMARGEVMITIETTPYDANGRAGKMKSDYCTFSNPLAED